MLKAKLALLFVPLLLSTLPGCNNSDSPDIPDVGVSADQLNKHLRLLAYPAFSTYRIGDPIYLEIRVETDLQVEISPDSDSHVFALDSATREWQRVQEVPDLGVFDSQTFVLSRKEGGVREISVDIDPVLPNTSNEVKLLVIVTGDVVQGGKASDQRVGAYIIVQLRPG